MKLFGSPTSPYVRKARVLIKEKNLPVEFMIEDPWMEGSPIIAKNPLSKVPALEIAPNDYIFESVLVVHFLDHIDGRSFTPRDPVGYWEAQRWQSVGNGIIDAVIARVLESRRPPEFQMAAKKEREEQRVQRAIAYAENMCKGSEFLVGNRFSVADLVLGVALQYVDFRYAHDWRSGAPKLAKWHAAIAARPSFVETQPPDFTPPQYAPPQ
jgi:glutathione S-transferase